MKRKNRILRVTNFTKIAEQKMELILQYIWAPIMLSLLAIWKMLHRHDREITECTTAHDRTTAAINDAKIGRKEIYDKIETVRKDLTEQHATLRKDQREDFKEVRDLIANIGK